MTKKSTERFIAFLDILQGTTSYAETSRALGQNPTTIWRWLAASKKDAEHPEQPSEYKFAYGEGDEIKYLHQHVRDAVNMSIEEIESAARGRARSGHYTKSMFQGRVIYQTNPNYDDPEMRELLGITDPWLRDRNGDRIPELVWHAPSTDLVQMILQAHSKKYRRQSQVNVDVNNRLSGGVMLLNGNQPAARIASQSAPLPMVEILESAEPEPVARASEADAEDVEAEEPAAVAPVQPAPPPNTGPNPAVRRSGLSDLERDLLARSQMKPDDPQRAAPVGVNLNNRDDYDSKRTGAGIVPPNGVRVS
jgi:hypothetical protein